MHSHWDAFRLGYHTCSHTHSTANTLLLQMENTHTNTSRHSNAQWHSAIPEGKQWIEKGSERCFGLPAEPQSSELQGLALPGPQGEGQESEGGWEGGKGDVEGIEEKKDEGGGKRRCKGKGYGRGGREGLESKLSPLIWTDCVQKNTLTPPYTHTYMNAV